MEANKKKREKMKKKKAELKAKKDQELAEKGGDGAAPTAEEEKAAIMIEKHAKGNAARKRVQKMKEDRAAAKAAE